MIFILFDFWKMKWQYIKKSDLKRDYRWDYIKLNDYFWNRWRITRRKWLYYLTIFWKYEKKSISFVSLKFWLSELLSGIYFWRSLTNDFLNMRGIYEEKQAEIQREEFLDKKHWIVWGE